MANKKAEQLIDQGFHPVLLGHAGDELKRPKLKQWQTAVYTVEDVRFWPSTNNIGIRCGWQRSGLALLVFDFDEAADRIFPDWLRQAAASVPEPLVIVGSGRGYHVYFFTETAYPGCTLAGAYGEVPRSSGRKRLFKFIETLGEGRQVVSAGSRHPSGQQYCFRSQATYAGIPLLRPAAYEALVGLSRTFDLRPNRPQRKKVARPLQLTAQFQGIDSCLDYARHYLGAPERVEQNGDIRFLGFGGLLITANGRGWYAFAEETGGGLAELIAWHQALAGEA